MLPYGAEGEIALTNIARDCMPLIRYRTGDISTLEPSVCGSHLMTLGHIRRRKEGATAYNGTYIYPCLLYTSFDRLYLCGMLSKEQAYEWLARLIQAPMSQAHIGYLGEYYCRQVIDASRTMLASYKGREAS